jgi:hypothetical protein
MISGKEGGQPLSEVVVSMLLAAHSYACRAGVLRAAR